LIFPDLSKWDGKVDFNVMKSKTEYVILKSSQGIYADVEFERSRSECLKLNLNYGVYHFYDDRVSPARQAQFFASLCTPRPAEIFCDWENSYHGDYGGIKNVVAFMQEVEKYLDMPMGMYTGYYFFIENTHALLNWSQLNYLKSRKLWLASYNQDYSNTGIIFVKVPRPWTKMDVWQFSDRADGHAYGCQSAELDMNERISDNPKPPVLSTSTLTFSNGKTYKEVV